MQLPSGYLNSFLISFISEQILRELGSISKIWNILTLVLAQKFKSLSLLKNGPKCKKNIFFRKMDDFLWSKNTVEPAWKRSSWQVFFTSAAILLLPSFSLRRLWQCSTVVVVRHDFIFPSLTFEVLCPAEQRRIEAAIFVLLSVKHSDDLLHFTADWSNKMEGASKQASRHKQFSRCIGKNNLCNCAIWEITNGSW